MAGYVELTAADLAYRWRERTVLESVDESVAEAITDTEYATADSALRWLLDLAWHDLQDARRAAIDGKWSISCGGYVSRIVGLTKLVGPCSWESVPVDLILDGVYERIHEAIGQATPLTDDDRRRAQAVMDRRSV
jgi:hypothetical protein